MNRPIPGLWKQKPQAWGPASAVQVNLFNQLNRRGIDPMSCELALPMWGPGKQINYGNLSLDVSGKANFYRNSLNFQAAGSDFLSVHQNVITTKAFTVMFTEKTNGNNDGYFCCDSTDPANFFIRRWYDVQPQIDCGMGDSSWKGGESPETLSSDEIHSHVISHNDNGDFFWVVDGKYLGKTSGSNFTGLNSPMYWCDRADALRSFDGALFFGAVLSTAISVEMAIALTILPPYWAIQLPTFRTYFIPTSSELALILANINQSQTIDNVDLLQQSILNISEIEQTQEISNILLSLSNLLVIAGISQSQLLDNLSLLQQIALVINDISQQQEIDSDDLIQQAILAVQKLSQGQLIDNLTLLSAAILTVAKLNQSQEIDTLTLLQQSNITIADITQNQLLDNIVLLYGDVLAITGISQEQTSDNISLVQQNLLSVADINQVQTTDSVIISVAGLLEIANLVQEQNLDVINLQQNFALAIDSLFQTQDVNNIILDSSQILTIQKLVQTQLVDVISLVQQSVLNVDEISQQQILDNIEIVITRISGKLSITFQLKTPGGRFTLR